jgi:hypothetical protein
LAKKKPDNNLLLIFQREYLPSFTSKRIFLLGALAIGIEVLVIFLIQKEKPLLCMKGYCQTFTQLPDNSTFQSARSSLLSYYSSESSSHATLILSLLIGVFTLVQIRGTVKKIFPFLLSLIFSLITYLSVRFFIWSQLSAKVLDSLPFLITNATPQAEVQFPAAQALFSGSGGFFIYFTYFVFPYYLAVVGLILLAVLLIVYTVVFYTQY